MTSNVGKRNSLKINVMRTGDTGTVLVKIIRSMRLLFSSYLGDYSYSFQGASEIISNTVTVSMFF